MPDTIKWKGEIEFEGSETQFREFAKALEPLPIKVHIPDSVRLPPRMPGYPPFPFTDYLKPEVFERLAAGGRFQTMIQVRNIPGGMLVPHVHAGDRIILLGHQELATYFNEFSQSLAKKTVQEIRDPKEINKTNPNV